VSRRRALAYTSGVAKVGWPARDSSRAVGVVASLASGRAPGSSPVAAHPCASCGICCHSYLVPVCGRDVWTISRTLHLEPERYLVAWKEQDFGLDRFQVEPDGALHTLVLDKRSWARGRSPCVFLVRLPGGQDRCGIYDQRPVACGAYPMTLLREAVTLREGPLCPPGSWPVDEPARPSWRVALQRARMQFDVYHLVVEAWNARLRSTQRTAAFEDFYDFILVVYDDLAIVDAELGAEAIAALELGWRAPVGGDATVADLPWQGYLDRVRGVLAHH
jgi:Fe-S-cluster containining protein